MKIDDILLTKDGETHIYYSEVNNIYMEKVRNDFLSYLKSLGFKCKQDKYPSYQECTKGNISIFCATIGRSLDIDVYFKEKYNRGKNYIEKKYIELYSMKCFKWILEYNKDLEFTYKGKVRNFLEKEKETKKMTAEQKIIKDFRNNCWHKPDTKDENFKLSLWDGTTVEDYNNRDRDKKIIYNGEIKYFYNYYGCLCKGKVYHNINNMWWVICNDKLYYNKAAFDLFDLTEEDLKCRRKKRHLLPETYLDKIDKKDPANKVRKILKSKIAPRKLGQMFSEYFEDRCIEKRNWKRKTAPETYYYVDGKAWSWNKVSCVYHTPKEELEIVYRENNYIIVDVNGNRIFELDTRILHWDKKALEKCFRKYNGLFKMLQIIN